MREVELKAVVDDLARRRAAVESAGGQLVFEGRLTDRRFGDESGRMVSQDHVLRLRTYEDGLQIEGHLDWKGPTSFEAGYKVRDELSSTVGDPQVIATILENLGYRVILEIEREIAQYELLGATVRFEVYPRMDVLVEVEGSPDEIEKAIEAIGIGRDRYSSERLTDFVSRFESGTGSRAALSARELGGDYRDSPGPA
jgi:predicted adenylyl cyclase CyaB